MKRLWLALATLLLLVTPAAAVPFTFRSPEPVRVFGGSWFPSAELLGPTYGRELALIVYIGPVPASGAVLHATFALDQQPPVAIDYPLPTFAEFNGSPVVSLGIGLEFTVPDTVQDYARRVLAVALVLPDDRLDLALDVMQPVPEPISLALLGSVLVAAGHVARKRRLGVEQGAQG